MNRTTMQIGKQIGCLKNRKGRLGLDVVEPNRLRAWLPDKTVE